MFNGYNDAPLISYNEFQQEGEKKQDNAQKWSYSHVAGVPTHAQSRQSEYWLSKPNILEITAPVHAPSDCNCSECYSSENNSYQSDSTRNRPWLPRRIAVPVNSANESCKLSGNHQWSNIGLTNGESCMVGNNLFPAQHAQHIGEKNSFQRSFQNVPLGEFHQPGVITSMKTLPAPDGHVLLKDKKETLSNSAMQEMAFCSQTGERQMPGFCPPTHDLNRNMEKKLDNRNCDPNFCDLNEKYANANHYRHTNNLPSCPLDSHIERSPVLEPYLKTVPLNLNHNRVPLNGHRNFKENLPKSCIDESLIRSGNGSRKIMSSHGCQGETERHEQMVFQLTKDGMLAETPRAKQQLQGLPSSVEADFKNNQIIMDYSRFCINRDLPKHFENKTEAEMPKKFLGESDGRHLDYYCRNSFIDSTKRNGQNSFQENKKDCIVNQLGSSEQPFGNFNRLNRNSEINFLEVNYPKASVSVYYSKESNVDKILKPEKCGLLQENPALIQRNGQNFFKNVENPGFNGCLNRPPFFVNDFQDHCFISRRQNTFPSYQNSVAACRNFTRPEYSCQNYNVPNRANYFHSFSNNTIMRNDGNLVNHRNFPQRMPDCGSANSAPFVPSGNNSFIFNSYCQPNGNFEKSHPQQIYHGVEQLSSGGVSMCSGMPHMRLEEPRVENLGESKEVAHFDSIKSKNLNKNGSNKISPLRLLRKKKSGCQKNQMISTSPVNKNNSESTPTLDVRKFWSTWADEEDDNATTTTTTATEMVVLDCQNINMEQAELLQLYGSDSIHNFNIKNGSPVFSKSSPSDKKFSSESPLVENHVRELNSYVKEFSLENDLKMNGPDIKKDINENQIEIINEIEHTQLETSFEKNSVASSSDSSISITTKNELNKASEINNVVDLNVAFGKSMGNSKDQNLSNYSDTGETHFVEKFDFFKSTEPNRMTNSVENVGTGIETQKGENKFSYHAEKILSADVRSNNIIDENIEKEKNIVGVIDNGKSSVKVSRSESESGTKSNANNTRKEPCLEGSSSPTMDEDFPSDSPKSEKCDLPNLPTSEYRRNKFLDYSDKKFSIDGEISVSTTKDEKVMKIDGHNKDSLKKVIESEVDTAISKNEISSVINKCYKQKCLPKSGQASLNDNPCDELSKNDIQLVKSESEFDDVKLQKETGSENFEMDSILQKFSEINFGNPQIKFENVADDVVKAENDLDLLKSPKKIRFKSKKMRKNKKKFKFKQKTSEVTKKVAEENLTASKPTIEFSIQKSHDLKISFKVLNTQGGDGKREKSLSEAITKESQIEEGKILPEDLRIETTAAELKNVEKDQNFARNKNDAACPTLLASNAKRKFKPKHPKRKISLKNIFKPTKSFTSMINKNDHSIIPEIGRKEKDTLSEIGGKYDGDHLSSPKPANYFSLSDFQVKESAKIKLTFKRKKGDPEGDYKVDDNSRKQFEPEDELHMKKDPTSFTTENSTEPTSCLHSLSGVEIVKPESTPGNVLGIISRGKEVSEEIQPNSENSSSMSLFPRILISESKENDEKIVKYSKCSSVVNFTYLQSDIIEIDGDDRNRNQEKSFLEKFSPQKIIDDEKEDDDDVVKSKNHFAPDKNLMTDILEGPQFVSFEDFSQKKKNLIDNETSADQLIGKELINCEDDDRLYNKYCKSPLLTDPDTLIKGENLNEVRFEGANSKDTLSAILRCHAEKDESLGMTKDPKNDSFNLDQSAHETEVFSTTSSVHNLTKKSCLNSKNEKGLHQLYSEQDSNGEINDFKIFESFNWPECRKEKENSSDSNSHMDFNATENSYCSSEAINLETVLEENDSEGATENKRTGSKVDDLKSEKFEASILNENLPKPITGNELPVDDSLFSSVEPFQVLIKSEKINALEKRWFNSFKSTDRPNETDDNNFEFIIDPDEKIVPSDSEKAQNHTNPENPKIDEINEALEAIFQETNKTCDSYIQKNENPSRLQENNQEYGLDVDYKKVSMDIENVLRESEHAIKTSKLTPVDSEGITRCEDEVKNQDEITQSNCYPVTYQCDAKVTKAEPDENTEKIKDVFDELNYKGENETSSTIEDRGETNRDEPDSGKLSEKKEEQKTKDLLLEDGVSVESFCSEKKPEEQKKKKFCETVDSNNKKIIKPIKSNTGSFIKIIKPKNCVPNENKQTFLNPIGPARIIKRRHSLATDGKLKIQWAPAKDQILSSKNESKIKLTYSEWKSHCKRAKSCPPLQFTQITSTDRKVAVLDIPVQEIPLPPGEPPPSNCFDLTKFNHKRKMSCDLSTDEPVCLNKEKIFEPCFQSFNKKNFKSQNYEAVNYLENLKTNNHCSVRDESSQKSLAQSPSTNNVSQSFSVCSNICSKKESEFQSRNNNDTVERIPSQNDTINDVHKDKDLNEAEKQESTNSDYLFHVLKRKQSSVHEPEIIKSDVGANCSDFIISESIKSEIFVKNFILDDEESNGKEVEEIKIPEGIAFSNEDCALHDEIEKLSEKFCENESRSILSNIHGELKTEPETFSGISFQESEDLEKPNLHKDCEELDSKLICDHNETEETEEIDFEKVEIVVGDSTCRTGFEDDIFTKDGFYECEDIPTSEDLPNVEEEKVSDDAKFRHMMQNCLDNAKKFLNGSNLKLFSSSVDDLLELECRSTILEERKIEKLAEDSTNHIPRDVLLTSCEDCVSDDMELSQKPVPSDLSVDFIPSFGSSNNLCPEVLPVDNWPYLEEEVPSSPVKPNTEDVIPFIENNIEVPSPVCKKLESKNSNEFFSDNDDINKLNNEKKLSDFSGNDTKFKRFRRKSLVCSDKISLIKHAKINDKRRKTLESFGQNPLSFRNTINKSMNDFKLEITEWKNGLEKIERFWLNTKDLKCRLNLNRIINEERANQCSENNSPKKNQKTNYVFPQNCKNVKDIKRVRPENSITIADPCEKNLNGFKFSYSDYKSPTWQPKVVLFRISKKQMKRFQKNHTKNHIDKKFKNNDGFLEPKHSIEENEKISKKISQVLESPEELSPSTIRKRKFSTDLEVSCSFREQSALKEKSIEKAEPNHLSKKGNNKIDENHFSKNYKSYYKIKPDHVLEKIVCDENSLLGKANKTVKTLTFSEKLHSINFQIKGDKKTLKKSRFRNLHGKKKNDSDLNSIKGVSPSSRGPSRSFPNERATLVDAERRLSEIFKDCNSESESVGKHQKSVLPIARDKIKRQSSVDGHASDLPEKKKKSQIEENSCHENGKTSSQPNASDRTIGRSESSLYKYKKKRRKSHSEKSPSESSRRDKYEISRSSKTTMESHKTNKDKFIGKQNENSSETVKNQMRPTNSKKRNDDVRCENQKDPQEKHLKLSKNLRTIESDGSYFENDCDQVDAEEKTEYSNLPLSENDSEDETSEKPWMCNVCGFNNANERMAHIKGHPFHCQSCHLAFRTEAHFVSHLTKKHKDIRNQHHCLLCELSFDTEKEYWRHLKTREHVHLETVEKNTINTLFTLLTGQPCPVLGLVELRPEWLPNQAGTVHFYHQATPLSLALQYLKMHHDLSTYSKDSLTHSS